jgi:ribonuclease P protein component
MDGQSATETKRLMDRIVHKADFERVLATRSRSRSTHFALHHLAGTPVPRIWQPKVAVDTELSTGPAPNCPQAVDEALPEPPAALPPGLWFGCVVPKRHARRAVTRTLLKRQVRSAFQRWGSALPAGLWLVRLRAPFSKQDFISARSTVLSQAARSELEALLNRALA